MPTIKILFVLFLMLIVSCSILGKRGSRTEKNIFNKKSKITRFYYKEYYLEDIPKSGVGYIEMKKISNEVFIFSNIIPLIYSYKFIEYQDTYQVKNEKLYKKIDNKFILLINAESKVETDKLIYTFPEKDGYDSSKLFMNMYEIKIKDNIKFYRFGFYGGRMHNHEEYDDYFCFKYGFIRKWTSSMQGGYIYELSKIVSDDRPKDTTFIDLKISWNSH